MRYTQWHTTALCSPTRSCLLTGRNHTRNSMACITEAASGFPNASGVIPPENGQIQQILGERGWNTYMVGKWHLCPEAEMNLASSRRNWPTGRGFERFYGFLGAETNQWYPELVYDSHPVDPPRTPEEGYHLTVDLTDKALEFIKDAKVLAPEKPFFLYYAPGRLPRAAPRAEGVDRPLQGPLRHGLRGDARADARAPEGAGHRPADTELPPMNPIGTPETRTGPDGEPFPALDYTRPWDSLSADEQRLFSRMAEVYAGFLAHADAQIGRLLDYLEETGQRENTMVILVSDNGASGEGGPNGSVNENKFANGIPDDIAENLAKLDELGGPKTYNHYPNGWAMAFNTPFKMWKRYEFNGGTSDPCIISWPAGIEAKGEIREQYHHADRPRPDDPRRARRRAARDDRRPRPEPLRRHQHALQLRRARRCRAPARRSSTRCSARAASGTTAGRPSPPTPRSAAGATSTKDTWELYHTDVDRSELHDLAAQEPERLQRADQPLVRRGGRQRRVPARRPRRRWRSSLTPRPLLSAAAQPLRLLPRPRRRARVPGGQHPQPLLRDRRGRRHPGAGRRGRAVRPRLALRRPRPLRQGQPAALRLQLRRQRRAEDRRRPRSCRPARA